MYKINFTTASEYVKNNPLFVGDVVVFIKRYPSGSADHPRVGVIESITEDSFGELWLAIPYEDDGCSCYMNISQTEYYEHLAAGKPLITHVLGRIEVTESA